MSPINIALLGTGGIARKHFDFFAQCPDARIVAACDVSFDVVTTFYNRSNAKDKLGSLPPMFTDAARMYAETKPDAVVICTPHTLHFEQAMAALDHGCHVLMEKPMVTNTDHAYQLKDKVDRTGKVLTVAYNTPCSPEFDYIRNVIRTQRLGRLEVVSGWISQGWFGLSDTSWRMQPKLSGGGMAYDSGAHLLNSLCWSVESNVAQVFAFVDNRGRAVDINSTINIRFDNGVLAAIAVGGNCPTIWGTIEDGNHSSDLIFMFEKGRIDVDGWNNHYMHVWEGRERIKYPPITKPPLSPAQNFIDAILGRDEPRTSPLNGIVHTELMDAIYESARTGQPAQPKRRA